MQFPLIIEIKENKTIEVDWNNRIFTNSNHYKISRFSNKLKLISRDDFYELKELWCYEISESFLENMESIIKISKTEKKKVKKKLNKFINEYK